MRIVASSFDGQEDGRPVIIAENHQGKLRFQILTTETPRIASFLRLGADPTNVGQPPRIGLLRYILSVLFFCMYPSSCVIILMTSKRSCHYLLLLSVFMCYCIEYDQRERKREREKERKRSTPWMPHTPLPENNLIFSPPAPFQAKPREDSGDFFFLLILTYVDFITCWRKPRRSNSTRRRGK